eukprot:6017284-Prymnesium_polylepis.1
MARPSAASGRAAAETKARAADLVAGAVARVVVRAEGEEAARAIAAEEEQQRAAVEAQRRASRAEEERRRVVADEERRRAADAAVALGEARRGSGAGAMTEQDELTARTENEKNQDVVAE